MLSVISASCYQKRLDALQFFIGKKWLRNEGRVIFKGVNCLKAIFWNCQFHQEFHREIPGVLDFISDIVKSKRHCITLIIIISSHVP